MPTHFLPHLLASQALMLATLPVIAADKVAPAATQAASAPSSAGSILTMMFGLLVVLGIMVGIAWLLKRSGLTNIGNNGVPVKIIGGTNVGPRERVMVVEIADQWLVIGVAPGRVNTLTTIPKQEYDATPVTPAASNFSSWLKQTIDKRHGRN